MDFIERWFHLSPDHGNGTTEAMFIVVAAVFVIGVLTRRRLASRAKRGADRTKENE